MTTNFHPKDRSELESLMADFKAKGGKIEVIPRGRRSKEIVEKGPKRRPQARD